MKLREKTLAAIISTFFITFTILLIISRSIFLKGFINLEDKDANNQVKRVVNEINMDLNNFSASNKDNSSWDDTYRFVQGHNQNYIGTALTDDTFRSLKINLLVIINNASEVVYQRGFDYINNKDIVIPKDISQYFKKDSPLLKEVKEKGIAQGYISTDEGIMMVVFRPILTSDGDGPSRGIFITARYLNEDEQQKFRNVTNISFNLQGSNDKLLKDISMKDMNDVVLVKPLNNKKLEVYTLVNDIYNKPTILLTADLSREIYNQGLVSIRYLTAFILIIGIIFIVVVLIILEKLIIKKILNLNNSVNRITKEQNTTFRVEVDGKDELAGLSEGVNSMLNSMESYISKLKISEERYRKSNEQLKELDKLKSDFLSTVSHEMRTPLTSILGFGKIVKSKLNNIILPAVNTTDEKVNKASAQVLSNLDIVMSESERLTGIINDLLDIAKMEAGKVAWKNEKVNIGQVIDIAINATAPLFEAKQLTINRTIEGELPDIIGDKEKILQVIINLLSNAVKFTEKGSITCKAELTENQVIVSVIDTGIGIKEEDYISVFERFKQVGDTLVNKPKGTGLGLPICKNIIEHHKGRIWVESEVNKGSKFSFSLPIEK